MKIETNHPNVFDLLNNLGVVYAVVCAKFFVEGIFDINAEDWCIIIHREAKKSVKRLGFYFDCDNRVAERSLSDSEIRWFKQHKDSYQLTTTSNDGLVYELKDKPFRQITFAVKLAA